MTGRPRRNIKRRLRIGLRLKNRHRTVAHFTANHVAGVALHLRRSENHFPLLDSWIVTPDLSTTIGFIQFLKRFGTLDRPPVKRHCLVRSLQAEHAKVLASRTQIELAFEPGHRVGIVVGAIAKAVMRDALKIPHR